MSWEADEIWLFGLVAAYPLDKHIISKFPPINTVVYLQKFKVRLSRWKDWKIIYFLETWPSRLILLFPYWIFTNYLNKILIFYIKGYRKKKKKTNSGFLFFTHIHHSVLLMALKRYCHALSHPMAVSKHKVFSYSRLKTVW